jgi:hypothetical protein
VKTKSFIITIISGFILPALFFISCGSQNSSGSNNDNNKAEAKSIIIPDSTKVIECKYVIADSVCYYEEPDFSSKSLYKASYSDYISVIEKLNKRDTFIINSDTVKGSWVAVKCFENKNRKEHQCERLYMFDGFLGELTSLKIRKKDLNLGSIADDYRNLGEPDIIDTQIQIGFTDYLTFENAKGKSIDDIILDTNLGIKTDGKLRLKITDSSKIITLKDTITDGELYENYTYIGYIASLNKFLVKENLYEEYQYLLIDRKTGNIACKLWETPIFTRDKKSILCTGVNFFLLSSGYMEVTEVLNKNSFKRKFFAVFQKWSPVEAYWIDNNSIVIKALYGEIYMHEWANLKDFNKDDFQYIRIDIL